MSKNIYYASRKSGLTKIVNMIGNPPFANNLSKIYLNELDDSEFVDLVQDAGYKKGDAYGFAVEEVEHDLLSAHLLLTRPEVRQVYNEEKNSVEEQEIQTIEKIPFRIDFKYSLLEVFANQDSTSTVTNKLGQLTSWETTIENANFSPREIMRSVEESYMTEMTSIKISNYSVSDSVVGDLSADVNDQETARSLLDDYSGDISYLGVRVGPEVDNVTLGIYESGSIVVYNDSDKIDKIVDVVKGAISGGDYSA